MSHKGKIAGIVGIAALLLMQSYGLFARPGFQASAPGVVSAGEQFRYVLLLDGSGTDLKLPDLAGFRLVSGPATSSSTSIQYINGQMTRTQSSTYTFVLLALNEGEYTIGPASIVSEGKTIESNPVTIQVSGGQAVIPSLSPQTTSPPTSRTADSGNADMFIRTTVSSANVFQGQPVAVTFKFYTRLDVSNLENPKPPSFTGFFRQEIETSPLRSLEREVLNGQIYATGILGKVLLFPQRTGELDIEPYELDVAVRERVAPSDRSVFDDFFGRVQTVKKQVVSNPVKVNAKPLPPGRPQNFSGAVGSFTIQASTDKTKGKAHEPITYRLRIAGSGNLKLVEQPRIDFPPGFEVYDPRLIESITNTESGSSGSRTYEILVIPRHHGNYRIPSASLSYFDPSAGEYKTVRTSEILLEIEQGEEGTSGTPMIGLPGEDVRFIGQDIRFIRLTISFLKMREGYFLGSLAFMLAFIIPLTLFLGVVIIRRKQMRLRADVKRLRNRRARKTASRRLKTAGNLLKQGKTINFYVEVLNSLWGYLGDKLDIPMAELSRGKAKKAFTELTGSEEEIDKVLRIIDACETARYSPFSPEGEMEKMYSESNTVIEEMENKIIKSHETHKPT